MCDAATLCSDTFYTRATVHVDLPGTGLFSHSALCTRTIIFSLITYNFMFIILNNILYPRGPKSQNKHFVLKKKTNLRIMLYN